MEKKSFSILICLFVILTFCSFQSSSEGKFRLKLSAKIISAHVPDSIWGEPNRQTQIIIDTKLENPTEYWVCYRHLTCDQENSLVADTTLLMRVITQHCRKNGLVIDTIPPYSYVKEELILTTDKSIKEIRRLRFRVGHPIGYDNPPRLAPGKKIFANIISTGLIYKSLGIQTIIWSDTLEIK